MAQKNHVYLIILMMALVLFVGCANTARIGQPFMKVPHPGKHQLAYFSQVEAFPACSMATVDGREFLAMEGVVLPSAQSLYLLAHCEIQENETVLDIGTGSGVQAIFAADKASSVLATDINPVAVKMAKLNAERNGVSDIVEFRQGDLFEPVNKDEKFDVILFNIAYPYSEESRDLWEVHERFFSEVDNYLNRDGRIYYQSGRIDNVQRINDMADKNGMSIISMRMDAALEVDVRSIVYLIKRNMDLVVQPGAWGEN